MNERAPNGDLYTSATADLSAGGVAMAREAGPQPSQPINDPTPARVYAREDLASEPSVAERAESQIEEGLAPTLGQRIDPTWAIASGAVVALGGGIGGAWLYGRWQRERNRPINQLRRRANGLWELVSDRLPEPEDVRDTAPMSGTAAVVLLGGVGLARLLHVGGWGRSRTDEVAARAARAAEAARGRGRFGVRWGRERLSQLDTSGVRQRFPKSVPGWPMSLRAGGVIGVAAVGYLAWRLLRGGNQTAESDRWYMAGDRREQVPNQ